MKKMFKIKDLNHQWLASNKTIRVLTLETDEFNIVESNTARAQLLEQIKRNIDT